MENKTNFYYTGYGNEKQQWTIFGHSLKQIYKYTNTYLKDFYGYLGKCLLTNFWEAEITEWFYW